MMSLSVAPRWRFHHLVWCLLIIVCCAPSKPLLAAVHQGKQAHDPLLSWTDGDKGFVYQREGRPDPFMPFIPEKLIEAPADGKKLTGMRRFEPGQLTLVSIVFTKKGPLAMVQDSSGKGYIIRKGTKIGRSGVVSKIVPNEVLIQQQMLTVTGEKRTRTVEMVLRKGEQ